LQGRDAFGVQFLLLQRTLLHRQFAAALHGERIAGEAGKGRQTSKKE
jgi:hypothetical protein